jgi:hypothetical protein
MTRERLLREIEHFFLEKAAPTGARIVGLDLSADLLAKAGARLGGSLRFE